MLALIFLEDDHADGADGLVCHDQLCHLHHHLILMNCLMRSLSQQKTLHADQRLSQLLAQNRWLHCWWLVAPIVQQ